MRPRNDAIEPMYVESTVVGFWRNGADDYQIAGALSISVDRVKIIIDEHKMILVWGNLLGAKSK